MHRHYLRNFIRQRRVISLQYVLSLLVLVIVFLISSVVLIISLHGKQKLLGILSLAAALALVHQIIILIYTCIDHSEFRIRELRQKLSASVTCQQNIPLSIQAALIRTSERHALITYARAQRDVELNNLVGRIIDGNFDSLDQINQALKPFSLEIYGQTYVLALFHTLEIPDDAFDLNVENSLREFGYPNPLAAFFRTIIGEMFGMDYACLICEQNGIFRCIVYTTTDAQASQLEEAVAELSSKIIAVFKDSLSITMLGAVSHARNDFGNLRISSDELNRLMDCRAFIENTKSVLTYGDLDMTAREEQIYILRMQQKQGLLDSITARHFNEARRIYKDAMLQCESENSSLLLSRFILSDMAYACLFTLSLTAEQESSLYDLLINTKSIQDYSTFFDALISTVEESPASPNSMVWTSQMAEYIEQHYADPALTVSSVSDHFHYNPIYATKAFKNDIGMNISEYIQEQRLNHSRKMLGKGYTIKEIAESSGFRSAATMTRVYTAKFGVTPGKLNVKNR